MVADRQKEEGFRGKHTSSVSAKLENGKRKKSR
jgi:hypothetical protein